MIDYLYLKSKLELAKFTLDLEIQISISGVLVLFGDSGAGKSTLLRIIAGLEPRHVGVVKFANQIWQDEKVFLPPYKRKIGYVFQHGQLFNHLNVAQNLSFASKRSGIKSAEIQQVYSMLKLEPLLLLMPNTLSGGQKQRVAFARCLLTKPQLLLLDEPFNAVDEYSKHIILEYLLALNLPTIYVTHSVKEVIQVAHYIVHIEDGKISGQGSLKQMLHVLERNSFTLDDRFV